MGALIARGTSVTLMRLAWLRWLALIPIVVALPFLFRRTDLDGNPTSSRRRRAAGGVVGHRMVFAED